MNAGDSHASAAGFERWLPWAALAGALVVDVAGGLSVLAAPFFALAIALLSLQGRRLAAWLGAAFALVASVVCEGGLASGSASPGSRWLIASGNLILFAGTALIAIRGGQRRKRLEEALAAAEARSFEDRLTGLPNRHLLLDRLSVAISQARRSGDRLSVMFIDLDRFKPINDEFGHHAGDAVLKAVAGRLLHLVRGSDTVARLGGDEFVILLNGLKSTRDAGTVAEKVIAALNAPITVPRLRPLQVGASIGIATFPEDGIEIDRLLANADAAMYRSKQAGRNRCTFADERRPGVDPSAWMAFDDALLTGVAEMDDQHRHLMGLAESLNERMHAGIDAATLAQRFDELVLYVKYHFATEERLMDESDDPGAERHRLLHLRLIREVVGMRARLGDGAAPAVLQNLKDWLLDHIVSEDRELARHILGKPGNAAGVAT